jgi:threonine/homoserine/homoserine lactone efflux protein
VAALLSASASLFSALKLAGAVFLVVLGLRSLWAAARRGDAGAVPGPARPTGLAVRDAYVQGLVGNLLNPKAGVIFVAIVPQFIEPADGPLRIAAMNLAFVLMATTWLAAYGTAFARAATHFGPRVKRAVDGAAGMVMLALGARLAMERRP